MSQYFNTGSDRISAEAAEAYAAALLGKPRCDLSNRELLAAFPAVRAHLRGATGARCKEIFEAELKKVIA